MWICSLFLLKKGRKKKNKTKLVFFICLPKQPCTHEGGNVNVVFRTFSKYGIFKSFRNKSNYHLRETLDCLLSWTVWMQVAFLI